VAVVLARASRVSLKPYSHWLIIAAALLVIAANRASHTPEPSNKCLEPRHTLTRDEIFHCRLRGYHLRN
jgi:hypothetical protein